ncbi:MAG: carboxymuconolactone decarboxylase family protein [Rhodothalassiaceae bacterium]
MAKFDIHTIETAPAGSKPLLEASQKAYGMVPNLHGVMAESSQHLEAYQMLGKLIGDSSLTTDQTHVVWLTINVVNRCHYCVPAHTMLAKNDKVDDDVIEAIRNEQPIADAKLEALRAFTIALTVNRGFVAESEVDAFLNAGYTKANILDILLVLSHKVLSNYTNHLADTPVDAPFAKFDWTAPSVKAAE